MSKNSYKPIFTAQNNKISSINLKKLDIFKEISKKFKEASYYKKTLKGNSN